VTSEEHDLHDNVQALIENHALDISCTANERTGVITLTAPHMLECRLCSSLGDVLATVMQQDGSEALAIRRFNDEEDALAWLLELATDAHRKQ